MRHTFAFSSWYFPGAHRSQVDMLDGDKIFAITWCGLGLELRIGVGYG